MNQKVISGSVWNSVKFKVHRHKPPRADSRFLFEQGADVIEQETGLTPCGGVVNLDKLAKWLLVVER
jgi:hypothetical protein